MNNGIRHFAIHADDVEQARRFYQTVFGWSFEPWGPPGFYLIAAGGENDPGLQGALQQRTEPLSGTGMRGFECTIGVADLGATLSRVEGAGGRLLALPYTIVGVGQLAFVSDTENNRIGVMQYED